MSIEYSDYYTIDSDVKVGVTDNCNGLKKPERELEISIIGTTTAEFETVTGGIKNQTAYLRTVVKKRR